jgi:bile acid-coenzyme A ligase
VSGSPLSLPAQLRALARDNPRAPVASSGDQTLDRQQLVRDANAVGAALQSVGVGVGDVVSLVLPTGLDAIVCTTACWFFGAIPQPLSPQLAPTELRQIVEVTSPGAVIGFVEGLPGDVPRLRDLCDLPRSDDLPDVISPSWKAPTSGGSTGRPKVIVASQPACLDLVAGFGALMGIDADTTSLVTAPLSHNAPFIVAILTAIHGGHAVLMPRFDPEETLRLIQEHRANWVYAVPTMMNRIMKLPEEVRDSYDVSSVRVWMHMAAPCAPRLKELFIGWLGPKTVRELYAGTEAQAATLIDGGEWLEHRGSVGRPVLGEMEIRDDHGPVPAGTVGRVWMRRGPGAPPAYRYIGATPISDPDGWETLGDLGWMDDEGYLYLADRESDMVLVGGSNVYPAEVEAALNEYPTVEEACVIGLPDDDLGSVLHALLRGDRVSDHEFVVFLSERLAKYKIPRTFEWVDQPLRDDAGKVRRSSLRQERLTKSPNARMASPADPFGFTAPYLED